MFIDKVKITVKSGDGGDGKISFRTEKYVPNGGPNGGDGGDGGSVIFVADGGQNSLLDFYYKKKFEAEKGADGESNNAYGKGGKDILIRVPTGTVIRDFDSQKIIADMFENGQKVVLAKGGKGGKGNTKFASATRQAPHFAQKGEKTPTRTISLELKTIADVALAGFPNAGKSTLLSVVSAAKPKIANYAFTTLSPNLGVAKIGDYAFTVADIPGLIEGASEGAGLGHEFLRHIERARFILHVVDMAGSEGRDPYDDYLKIKKELVAYSAELAALPFAIAANKMDFPEAEENLKQFKKKVKKASIFPISALKHEGLKELLGFLAGELQKLPPPAPLSFEPFEYPEADIDSINVEKTEGEFIVSGGFAENLLRRVNLGDPDSFVYFQKLLKDKGIMERLRTLGAKEGDNIIVGDCQFEFVE